MCFPSKRSKDEPPAPRLHLELHTDGALICTGDTAPIRDYLLKPYGFVWTGSGRWRRPGPSGRQALDSFRRVIERDGQALLEFSDMSLPLPQACMRDKDGARLSSYYDDLSDDACIAVLESTPPIGASLAISGTQSQSFSGVQCQHVPTLVDEQHHAPDVPTSRAEQRPQCEGPLCEGHSAPCVRRVTNKPGRNFARKFYVCALTPQCRTFVWEDELLGSTSRPQLCAKEVPPCIGHGEPCKAFQVRKHGPTQGKWFYKCSKTPQCETFIWEIDLPAPSHFMVHGATSSELRLSHNSHMNCASLSYGASQTISTCQRYISRQSQSDGQSGIPTKRQLIFTDDDLDNLDFLDAIERAEQTAVNDNKRRCVFV